MASSPLPNKISVFHFEASEGLGRGEYFVDLANEQSLRTDLYHEIVIVSPEGSKYIHRLNKNVRHIPYKSKGSRNNIFLLLELYKIFKNGKPNIVHTHFNKATSIYSRIARFLTAPWVSTKHNPRPTKAYKKAPYVIAVSDMVKASLKHQNVYVIHNGIDISKASKNLNCLSNKPIKLLSVGRLEKIKGFDRLIKALAKLPPSLQWHLNIVGEGQDRNRLQELLMNLELEKHVSLLGFRSDIRALMQDHHLTIVSSYSEGFGLVMLEALLHSPLLTSTQVGIAKEILPDELILSDKTFDSSLIRVINDHQSLCQKFNLTRSIKLRPFSMKKAVNEHHKVYRVISENHIS